MRCDLSHDAAAFWPDVHAFLAADPVVHNVLATNIEARSRGGALDEGTPGVPLPTLSGGHSHGRCIGDNGRPAGPV